MPGRHTHPQPDTSGRRTRAFAAVGLMGVLAVVITAMALLWPDPQADLPPTASQQVISGAVAAMHVVACPDGSSGNGGSGAARPAGCGTAEVVLDDGRTVRANLPSGAAAPDVNVGDDVTLTHTRNAPADLRYQIVDQQRGTQLWLICAAFALAIVAFGRWRGLAALAGLAITFAVLLRFVVPAILDGKPPLLVAVVGSAFIMLTVLYLTHGVSRSTTVAVLGTLASLALTGVLAFAAVTATSLTGVADEATAYVGEVYSVDTRGLLLAGIIIGALGVLDDVTVTQVATVDELARANPGYRPLELYRGAIRVGRAHIAAVINTIVLAYAGAALPLLVLILAGSESLGRTLSDQLIAQEIVRSAVGTLGLIAAVPITTGLAALAAGRAQRGPTAAEVTASP
jgi:uncharacterized membrane protein